MKVICLVNEKGGSGKSTLSINLATALHRAGKQVILLDADPQGTARDWRDASPADADLPPVLAADRPNTLTSAFAGIHADFVVIDAPAKAEAMSAAIIGKSDIALIVVQPSAADVWASAAIVKMVQSKRSLGGVIEAAFVVNRATVGRNLTAEITSGDWNEYGIDQLENFVSDRESFKTSLAKGLSIFDTNDSKAKAEIELIIQEIENEKWF
ncbi:MAG: cobyrinic acid ac-diamide synthase [Cupriavidus sp.]|nr:cobyrinic acid ac-diamide synthase [Cupriavidus sp.]